MKTWLTGAFLCVTMLATAHEMKTPPSRVAENQVEKQVTGGDLVVAPLEGEFWWGGMTALGSKMPYASDTRLWNLERQN